MTASMVKKYGYKISLRFQGSRVQSREGFDRETTTSDISIRI